MKKLLGEWGITFESRVTGGRHKPRKYRAQYGETDFDFVRRMLEDAGISYYFSKRERAAPPSSWTMPPRRGTSPSLACASTTSPGLGRTVDDLGSLRARVCARAP